MKAKYPIKVAGIVYPKGTLLRVATGPEVLAVWPGMRSNPDSTQVAVVFPDRTTPTIVARSQVEF